MVAAKFLITLLAVSLFSTAVDAGQSDPPPIVVPQSDASLAWIVPVNIGGKSYSFLVDTACTLDIFGETILSDLGESIGTADLKGFAGDALLKVYRNVGGRIAGKAPLAEAPVVRMNLSALSESVGKPLDGVLGLQTISQYAWRIDPDRHEIQIAPSARAFDTRSSQKTPMIKLGAFAAIVALGPTGTKVPLVLDTGYSGWMSLSRSNASLLLDAKSRSEAPFIAVSETVSGRVETSMGRVPSIVIFGKAFKNIHAELPPDQSLVGMELLRRFVVVIDFAGSTLYSRPASNLNDQQRNIPTGIVARVRPEGLVVAELNAGGAWDVSALRPADIIVDVGGVAVSSPWALSRALADSSRAKITIVRANVREQATIVRRR